MVIIYQWSYTNSIWGVHVNFPETTKTSESWVVADQWLRNGQWARMRVCPKVFFPQSILQWLPSLMFNQKKENTWSSGVIKHALPENSPHSSSMMFPSPLTHWRWYFPAETLHLLSQEMAQSHRSLLLLRPRRGCRGHGRKGFGAWLSPHWGVKTSKCAL